MIFLIVSKTSNKKVEKERICIGESYTASHEKNQKLFTHFLREVGCQVKDSKDKRRVYMLAFDISGHKARKDPSKLKQIILQASYLTVLTMDERKHGHANNLSTNGLFSIHLEGARYQPLRTFFASYWFSSQESL